MEKDRSLNVAIWTQECYWTTPVLSASGGRIRHSYGDRNRRARAADMGKRRLGRGLHPERWGRVAFVWPEKPFRAVSDVYPVTYFPKPKYQSTGMRKRREGG